MKILVVSNLYPPHVLGGYEILCGQVKHELEGRGHRLSVLTSTHGLEQGLHAEPGVGVVTALGAATIQRGRLGKYFGLGR